MKKPRRKKCRKILRTPKWVKGRIESLLGELKACSDPARRSTIRKELANLRRTFDDFSSENKPKPRRTVPLPKSYVEEWRAKNEAARRISGRGWVQFVQGGAPGSGRKR